MPDSIPTPPWGSALYDDRDLDALLAEGMPLSEATGIVPPVLRPVADTLAALQAGPSPAELRGEAAVRAEFRSLPEFQALADFRAMAEFRALEPGRSAASSEIGQPGTGKRGTGNHRADNHGTGTHATGSHGAGRHGRQDRTPARGRRGKLTASAFAAAAVIIAVAAAYSGTLPGPAQRLAHVALNAPAAATTKTPPGMDAKSARAVPPPSNAKASGSPSTEPSVPASASGKPVPTSASLCDAFYMSLGHLSPGQLWWQTSAYRKVSAAAGGPRRVPAYCAAEWSKLRPHDYPQVPVLPGSGNQVPGNQVSGNQVSGSQVSGNQVPGTGISGAQVPGTSTSGDQGNGASR